MTRAELTDLVVTIGLPFLASWTAADVIWGEWHPATKPVAWFLVVVVYPIAFLFWIGFAVDVRRRWLDRRR